VSWKEYKKNKQNANSIAKGKKQKECANDLNDPFNLKIKKEVAPL